MEGSPQIYSISSGGELMKGDSPVWGLDEVLKTPHRKKT